jgi:hypothetical protein
VSTETGTFTTLPRTPNCLSNYRIFINGMRGDTSVSSREVRWRRYSGISGKISPFDTQSRGTRAEVRAVLNVKQRISGVHQQ